MAKKKTEQELADEFTFEMDDAGNFRITFGNRKGEWASYPSIARLVLPNGQQFLAVSQYFEGVLVPERVYHIQLLNSKSHLVKGTRPE